MGGEGGKNTQLFQEKNVLNTDNISGSVEDSPIVFATFSATNYTPFSL
jgi:hypothetical protein